MIPRMLRRSLLVIALGTLASSGARADRVSAPPPQRPQDPPVPVTLDHDHLITPQIIVDDPMSGTTNALLDAVAALLKREPLLKIEVQGYMDDGDQAKELSQRHA